MSWKNAIVQVRSGDRRGTGVFIAADVVLTAGHVLKSASAPAPDKREITAIFGSKRFDVDAYAIHPDFLARGSRRADMALLRTTTSNTISLTTQLAWDPRPDDEVALDGYPLDTTPEFQVGHVRREGPLERYFLISDDLQIAHGLSGAPLLIGEDQDPQVAGIAVWSNDTEGVSVPLLRSTLGTLESRLFQL